jgi:hypothetical protein
MLLTYKKTGAQRHEVLCLAVYSRLVRQPKLEHSTFEVLASQLLTWCLVCLPWHQGQMASPCAELIYCYCIHRQQQGHVILSLECALVSNRMKCYPDRTNSPFATPHPPFISVLKLVSVLPMILFCTIITVCVHDRLCCLLEFHMTLHHT